jgi:hypothetical protein
MTEVKDTQDTPLYCFIDANRVCDMDCTAYLSVLPQGDDYVEQPFAKCMLLVSLHRVGKHSTIVASELVTLRKNAADHSTRMRKATEDSQRLSTLGVIKP